MHLKQNDKVIVRSGKDRGLTGDILEIDYDNNRVKVSGCNIIVQHQQPEPMLNQPGERLETEGWIDASNVALYSEERGGPVRTGTKFVGDSGELHDTKAEAEQSFGQNPPDHIQKVRVGKQTGEVFDEIEPY